MLSSRGTTHTSNNDVYLVGWVLWSSQIMWAFYHVIAERSQSYHSATANPHAYSWVSPRTLTIIMMNMTTKCGSGSYYDDGDSVRSRQQSL